MTRAKKLLFEVANSSHTEVNYIKSTGTQWINTGVIGRSGVKVEIKVQFDEALESPIFGARTTAISNTFSVASLYYMSPYYFRNDYNTSIANDPYVTTLLLNTPYTLIKDDGNLYINGVLKDSKTPQTFTSGVNMYLFTSNTNGTVATLNKMRVYYMKIWDNTGTLVRDFIPVIKNSVACLYDKVTKTYFYNQGTGVFSYA